MKCNWGADYADPATWTEPFSDTGSDSYLHWRADTAAGVRDIIAEYDAVAEAKAQVEDMSVRYNIFAQAGGVHHQPCCYHSLRRGRRRLQGHPPE